MEAATGRIVVRYIYSGNEKIAMERVDATTGARSWYYFVNNAQGSQVLILDESGSVISRLNTDEWGNVGQLIGPASEVNYTGKKMDPETGLYYFNQRYYDPSLGRFLTEDPAGQGLNPYAYAGNSPLMYVDPDGEWFFTAILSAFGPLGTLAGAALDGGMMSAAINVGAQLVMTGQVNWSSVGNSFASGALSAGLSFGVGEMGAALGMGKDLAFTTIAHGISGGIQSAAFGGNFWSGVAGGVAGNLGGSVMGNDLVGRLGVGALAGGAASWAAGGDFWQGAQAGAYNGAFNYVVHEGANTIGAMLDNFPGLPESRQAKREAEMAYGHDSDGVLHNDKGDAFRHARWSQLMARNHNRAYSFFVGLGHELDGALQGQPFSEFKMDMHNNWKGLNSVDGPIPLHMLQTL